MGVVKRFDHRHRPRQRPPDRLIGLRTQIFRIFDKDQLSAYVIRRGVVADSSVPVRVFGRIAGLTSASLWTTSLCATDIGGSHRADKTPLAAPNGAVPANRFT